MKRGEEGIALLKVGQQKADAFNAGDANVQFGNVLDQVNSQNDVTDILSTLGFEIVNGYDNFTLVSSLASFIVKCETTPEMVTSDHLKGQTAIIIAILSWRLLGSVFSVISEKLAEDDRIEKETKKIVMVIERHRAMLSALNELPVKNNNNNSRKKIKDKWADFNASLFNTALQNLSNKNLSELELQELYYVFRSAVGNKATQEDLQAWEKFIQDPTIGNREELRKRIEAGLKTKVKATPIADKDTRFVGRVLRLIGNFIMANATGMSIVVVMSGFIAAIPFVAALGFSATLPIVFLVALGLGIGYGCLTLTQEMKKRRHQKIAEKLKQEKVRYKQNQAINSFSSMKNMSSSDVQESMKPVSLDDVKDSMRPISENQVGSLSWRILFNIPFILSNATVSGWWAVLMGVTVVTGLIGGAGLVGVSAILFPAIVAGVFALFSLTKFIVNAYHDYHFEREKIQQINNNLAIQKLQATSSQRLRDVVQLSERELLKEYITALLTNTDSNRKKKDFHLIEKMIGAKLSDAQNADAFYGFLASKLIDGNIQSEVESQRTSTLELIKNLRNHVSGEDSKDTVNYHDDFKIKPVAFKESFRAVVGYGFSITAPIVVGLGVAMAFVLGPAFLFVGVGMAALLCGTYYVSTVINERRDTRVKKYDSMLAQIDMRDRLTDIKLSQKYSLVKSQSDTNKEPAPEKIIMSDALVIDSEKIPQMSSARGSVSSWGFQLFFNCGNKSDSLEVSSPMRSLEKEMPAIVEMVRILD